MERRDGRADDRPGVGLVVLVVVVVRVRGGVGLVRGVRLRLRAGLQSSSASSAGSISTLEVADVRGAVQLEFAVELGLVVEPAFAAALGADLAPALGAAALARGVAAFPSAAFAPAARRARRGAGLVASSTDGSVRVAESAAAT